MELQIQGRNIEINDQIRAYIAQKMAQVNRHLPAISRAEVELASESTRSHQDRIVVQVTLDAGGAILRAEQRAANTTAAINLVAEALDRRVERYKSRAYRSERARQNTPLRVQQAEEISEPAGEVAGPWLADGGMVRVKRFDMKPMTVDEAAFQMELLGHTFFMFLNSDSGQYNVLYQRDDGNHGLIQPASG
ncbi:MAG: ribosome-associated translation inhibitor RaiA [Chloroflexota bacterium]